MWTYPTRKATTKGVLDIEDIGEIIQPLADAPHSIGAENIAAGAFTDRNDLATDSYFRYYESHAGVDSGLTATTIPTGTSGTKINLGVGWQVLASWSKETRGDYLRVLYNVQVVRESNDRVTGLQFAVRVNGAVIEEMIAPTTTLAQDPYGNVYPALSAPIARTMVIPNSPGSTTVELLVRSLKAPTGAWDYMSSYYYATYVGSTHLAVIDFVR